LIRAVINNQRVPAAINDLATSKPSLELRR
jgi:hypothetical protein